MGTLDRRRGAIDEFHDAVLQRLHDLQLRYLVEVKARGTNVIERMYATRMPAPFLSMLTDDCIAKGSRTTMRAARATTRRTSCRSASGR